MNDADRIVAALKKRPRLLHEVLLKLHVSKVAGPWETERVEADSAAGPQYVRRDHGGLIVARVFPETMTRWGIRVVGNSERGPTTGGSPDLPGAQEMADQNLFEMGWRVSP